MNESTFKFIHDNQQGNINNPDTININFDVDPNDSNRGIITGLTVTTSDYNSEDITTVLEQVEKIEITLQYNDGVSVTEINKSSIVLEITSREKRKGFSGNNPYFYFIVKPVTIFPINNTGREYKFLPTSNPNNVEDPHINTTVFTPVLSKVKFLNDDYNPLISNASLNRPSTDKQVSDRNQLSANPSNLESILAGTAEAAQIPDSNYSDTGLVNSRYEGSLTTSKNFGGISPAFTGKEFIGEIFSEATAFADVSSSNNRVLEDLFQTSNENLPTFRIVTSSIKLAADLSDSSTTASFTTSSLVSQSIDIGNIINIGSEFMRVENIDSSLNQLTLIRGYLDDKEEITSTPASHDNNSTISVILPTRIFKFGTGTTKIQSVENSRVFVKETSTILETDKFGTVFNSSSAN